MLLQKIQDTGQLGDLVALTIPTKYQTGIADRIHPLCGKPHQEFLRSIIVQIHLDEINRNKRVLHAWTIEYIK